MENIQGILSNRQEVDSLIGLGLSDVNLRVNNKFWLTTLQNKFGGSSFLKTYQDDPQINWFYMYQKYAQQELAIHGDNEYSQISSTKPDETVTSFLLPFPTIQVFIPNNFYIILLLSLNGKIYKTRHRGGGTGRVFEELIYIKQNILQEGEREVLEEEGFELPHKIQKVVCGEDCLFLLTEDYEVYGLELTEGEFYDYRKLDVNFKVTNITGNKHNCIIYDEVPNKFVTVRGIYNSESDIVEYTFHEYSNVTPIKEIVTAEDGILILDIHGRVYNMLDSSLGQTGHYSHGDKISCLNYRFKVKKMYSIGTMSFLQDISDNIYKLGDEKYHYPTLITNQPYIIRNIVGNDRYMILHSKFDDYMFQARIQAENIDDYNPMNDNEGFIAKYEKSIALIFPGEIKLKEDINTRDFTYEIFTSNEGKHRADQANTLVLTYGVIEEDKYFLKTHPEILVEKENTTPNYIIKNIGGRTYLYTRLGEDDDLIRIQINYNSATGTILSL